MPNVIKYGTSAQRNTIKKGNVLLGVNTVDYGPTSTTGFWNGVIPQTSGYTIYVLNTANTSPSIIQISGQSNADTWLPSVGGFNITGFTNTSQYFNTFLSNTMLSNKNYENIVTSGLVMNLDATYLPSYYGSGDLWTDLNGRLTTPNSIVRNFAKPLNEWVVIRSNVSEVTDGSVPPPFTGAKVWKSQTSSSFANTLHRMWSDGNANGITWGLGSGYTRYYMWVRGERTNSTNCSVSIDISDAAPSGTVVIGRNTNWTLLSSWDISAGSYNASKFFDLDYPTQTSGDIYYISSIVVAAYSAVSMSQLISFPGYLGYSQTGVTYNQGLLVNGPTYLPSLDGAINFDGSNDYCDFVCTGLTTTATVEMVCKIGSGYSDRMFFGWYAYDIYCGGSNIGFNTANSDVYGISSTQVTSLGLVNNWKHYVFEMRSDVSYTNNKIYINGSGMTLSQLVSSENSSNRNFNNGSGRIAAWRLGNSYNMPMDLTYFRVYNRSLSQSEILQNYYKTNLVTSGMVLNLDAANIISYPKTGTAWIDLSTNRKNGTLTNSPSFSTRNGGTILFDGVDDYVSVSSLTLGVNWTIESWFNLNSYPSLANVYSTEYGEGWYASSLFGGSRNIGWYLDNNWRVTANNLYTTNNWYHLVSVVDGLNHYYYLNGVRVLNYTSTAVPTSTSFGTIGRIHAVNERYFPGFISGCIAYNRALSATEVLQNYDAQKYKFL